MVFLAPFLIELFGLSLVPHPKTTHAPFHVMKPGLPGLFVIVIVTSKTEPTTSILDLAMVVLHVHSPPTSPKLKLVLLDLLKTVLCMVHSVMM